MARGGRSARPGRPRLRRRGRPHTSLTPLRARAVGRVPRDRDPNVTLLAALTPDGIGPAMVLAGAADGDAFVAYVERLPAPSLRLGQVVVWDNLGAHARAEARAAVEARGCAPKLPPASSPDFSPIEQAFAKVKQRPRRAEARTREALAAASGEAIDAVTPADARSFFAHCGYPLPDQLL